MDSTEKALLIGGLVVGGWLLFSAARRAQAQALANLNQPGLQYQPSMPPTLQQQGNLALGSVISGLGVGLGNLFAGLGSSDGSNDPGLEGSSDIDYPGDTYTYANSNSYSANQTGVSAISSNSDSSSYFDF